MPMANLQPQMTESPVKKNTKKSRSPSPRNGSFRIQQMSPQSIRKTQRLMTSGTKPTIVDNAKKERFADLIVILGLKYQEFNGK